MIKLYDKFHDFNFPIVNIPIQIGDMTLSHTNFMCSVHQNFREIDCFLQNLSHMTTVSNRWTKFDQNSQ